MYPDLSTHHDWPVKKGLCFVCHDRQSGWREIQNAPPVIRWVRWGSKTRISALLHRRSTNQSLVIVFARRLPLYNSQFLGGQSIHWLLFRPLYNGRLSTISTFFCPQGGHCREVQLYYVKKFNYHALSLIGGSLMLLVIPGYLVALLLMGISWERHFSCVV